MLIFGFYIAQNNKNPHVTLFKHCISKTARYSILTPLVKKSYLGDKLLNPEYQVIASESVNTPTGLSVPDKPDPDLDITGTRSGTIWG